MTPDELANDSDYDKYEVDPNHPPEETHIEANGSAADEQDSEINVYQTLISNS